MKKERGAFAHGLRDGIPIAAGYFTVSVSLGIALQGAGLSPVQAGLMSVTNMTSAGQFAGATAIAAGSGYLLMAIMQLLINARYLLMSCALSQRLKPGLSLGRRLLLGMTVTDEIFGICIAAPGDRLDHRYALGAFCIACPGWTLGTVCGTVMGDILPARLVSALSVALFGMLIAVFIPPTKKDKVVWGAVLCAMALSLLFATVPLLARLSEGLRLMLLTVVIALAAAVFFPIQDREKETSDAS